MKKSDSGRVVFRESKRIYLRPPFTDDVCHLVRWFNNYEITRFLSCRLPVTEVEEKEWVEHLYGNLDQLIPFVIVLKGKRSLADRPIGTIQLHQIDRESGTALKGMAIGETDCWNLGYGTEANMLLLEFAFNTLNLRKIYSHVFSTNKTNIRCNTKCGFVHEATLSKHHFREGEYVDELIFSVYAETWRSLWQKTRGNFISIVSRKTKEDSHDEDSIDRQ